MEVVSLTALFAAGIGMGLGAIGSAIGEGYAAGRALEGMARQPKVRDVLTRDMLIGQAVSETPGIFALVISVTSTRPASTLSGAVLLRMVRLIR